MLNSTSFVNASVINEASAFYKEFNMNDAVKLMGDSDETINYVLYNDKYGLINTFYPVDKYALLINDRNIRAKSVFRSTPEIIINCDDPANCDELLNSFYSFAERNELNLDDIRISKEELKRHVRFISEILDKNLAEKFYDELSEKEFISEYIFSAGGFYSSEVELFNWFWRLTFEEAQAVKLLLEDIGYNDSESSIEIGEMEEGFYFCKLKTSYLSSIDRIKLYETVYNKLKIKPYHMDWASTDFSVTHYTIYLRNRVTGDLSGDKHVDLSDLTSLSLVLIGDETLLSADQKKAADVNKDGKVTLSDLAVLKQYLSKQIDSL